MRTMRVLVMFSLLAMPAVAAGNYDHTDHFGTLETRLTVPAPVMDLGAVKAAVFARYQAGLKTFQKEALTPRTFDETWRVSYESARLISLTAEIFWDGGGAHPNSQFETLIWDKSASRALGFADLFAAADRKAAQEAVAKAGVAAWVRIYAKRAGTHPSPDLKEMATEGIAADDEHLKNVALMFEAGESKASGLLLLYGAGEIWPHVIGDFRIPVPASAFARYLKPEWRGEFR